MDRKIFRAFLATMAFFHLQFHFDSLLLPMTNRLFPRYCSGLRKRWKGVCIYFVCSIVKGYGSIIECIFDISHAWAISLYTHREVPSVAHGSVQVSYDQRNNARVCLSLQCLIHSSYKLRLHFTLRFIIFNDSFST